MKIHETVVGVSEKIAETVVGLQRLPFSFLSWVIVSGRLD